MEEKQEKKTSKITRIITWIIALIFVYYVIDSGSSSSIETNSTSTSISKEVKKTDSLQERIEKINSLFIEESSFEKAEKIDNSTIGIYFYSTPEEDIDLITRGQAVNLSNDLNGVASVKTFVWWSAQMFCVATKWSINDCSDYR